MYLTKGFINKVLYNFRLINQRTLNPRYFYTSSVIMEKAMESLEQNPYFDKYAEKISKLQKTSPEEFLRRAEKNIKKETSSSKDAEYRFSCQAEKGKVPLPNAAYAFAPQKKLDSIMKTELLKDRTVDEIKYIWTEYFLKKDAISGIMPNELFEKIQNRAAKYPMFIFPLPRNQGYEFIYIQFAANEIHFTPLINYQAYQENAPECLTMIHYPDLSEEKGIVLMHGEYNKDVINAKDAQFLANQVTLYYGKDDVEKLKLLESFHKAPNEFKHMELIEQLEKLDLSVLTGSAK